MNRHSAAHVIIQRVVIGVVQQFPVSDGPAHAYQPPAQFDGADNSGGLPARVMDR